jgi:hypothetical protein
MKSISMWLVCLLFLSNTFASPSGFVQAQAIDETFSFENDFEGWAIRSTGADIESDLPPPVTRSQERATDGGTSLRVIEGRRSPFQIVWVEKVFDVEPNQSYDVVVNYDFASRDCCRANSLGLLTGVAKTSPDSTNIYQLRSAGQEPTGDDDNTSGEYKWYGKKYKLTAHTNEQGKIYVMIGIIAGEFGRPYFFDNIRVQINKREVPCDFFSFENELEGWTPKAINTEFLGGYMPWSVTCSQEFLQDGAHSVQFDIDSINGKAKVWIEKAFPVEPGRKYRVNIEYGFFNQLNVPNSTLITGIARKSPLVGHAVEPFYQEDTGTPGSPWKRKQYEFIVKSKQSSTLYAFIGVFAKQTGIQLYNFDNVCISITPK